MRKYLFCLPIMIMATVYGCGASSPSTPAQIPSSIEYAGGEVIGAISVQMGKTLSFVAKDADGVAITDPSNITIELLTVSASSNLAAPTKQLDVSADTVVTDGSCGTAAVSGSNIVYTAPSKFPPSLKCKLRGTYEGSTLSGQFETLVSLEPTIAASSAFVFSSSVIKESAYNPNIDLDDNGNLYVCYNSEIDNKVYLMKSTDNGTTWSTPVLVGLESGPYSPFVCAVSVNSDGTKVAVGGRYSTIGGGSMTAVERLAYSTDGGASFASAVQVYGMITSSLTHSSRAPIMEMDSSGVVHMVVHVPGTLMGSFIYLSACTATACSDYSTTEISGSTGYASSAPQMTVASDDTIYVVWIDSSADGEVVPVTYASSAYTVGTVGSFTNGSDASANPGVIMDRDSVPVISWEYTVADPYSSDIYIASWDTSTKQAVGPVQASDASSSLLKFGGAPFIDYGNYRHLLYKTLDVGEGKVWYTMQNGSGYIDSIDITLTGFDYSYSKWNVQTNLAGRPYVIWNSYIVGTYGIYLSVGTTP